MKTYEPHQLLDEQVHPPKHPADEEDTELLLERTFIVLAAMLDRKLPKALHNETARLLKDIEDTLSWHRLQ